FFGPGIALFKPKLSNSPPIIKASRFLGSLVLPLNILYPISIPEPSVDIPFPIAAKGTPTSATTPVSVRAYPPTAIGCPTNKLLRQRINRYKSLLHYSQIYLFICFKKQRADFMASSIVMVCWFYKL